MAHYKSTVEGSWKMVNQQEQTGLDQIIAAFARAGARGTAALMPYYTLGYPDRATSLDVIAAIAADSDLLELGVPFSDPLADGPTIQHSTQVSLERGTTLAGCLEMLRELRGRGIQTPVLLFGYYNPFLAYGLDALAADARAAGAQGFIVPDLPPEEAADLESAAAAQGLAYVHFLAPTSSPRRIAAVAERARGFIYLVSVAGVTGARQTVGSDLAGFIGRVRQRTTTPLAVGFGISTPEQAAAVGRLADGVIVGSALINAVDRADDKPQAAAAYIRSLHRAINHQKE
ncbi:Tryptophan synthase alpha chain [Candidatus Promineifilum breve]|uniref:Tryptophan synthase alpha chain n=1 Tax=Candidatus Promineifilum breve TaxID=1806508 RepID=A0A160T6R3_9CHLR|nr:Tryptophan synthase alpha chain [Candidatus Promineifilum breve]